MGDANKKLVNYNQLRGLKQYKEMTDDDFDDIYEKKMMKVQPSSDFEKRIQRKLREFEKDYDITDLKINDREALRALIQALISLEDFEQLLFAERQNGISMDNLLTIDKINKVMSDLRSDISKLQDDLKITRKIRKSDQETSVLNYIESLKLKAKKFAEAKMMYIFCTNCNTLLATLWVLYPSSKNRIILTCKKDLGNKIICDTKIDISTKELFEKGGTNKPENMPEGMM